MFKPAKALFDAKMCILKKNFLLHKHDGHAVLCPSYNF